MTFIDSPAVTIAGAYASLVGLLVALIGFGYTLRNINRTERAATRAEEAAKDAVDKIKLFDTVSGFASALSILEEIKRLHRTGAWQIVLDRYAALKKILVDVRALGPPLSEHQNQLVQRAITNLSAMEKAVENALAENETPQEVARFNAMLSKDIEGIQEVLAEIKDLQKE